MEDAFKGLGALFAVLMLIPILALIHPFIGAGCGWLVGLVFPDTMTALCRLLGVAEPYQAGAMLAFVGAFFRVMRAGKD